MRNPLDLNNLPDDFTKQTLEDDDYDDDDDSSSASGISGQKKDGGRNKHENGGKLYKCRFCSLKFCKSQALGGHMNRHRQERETEALNQARQLVFSNDSILPPLRHQLGGQQVIHGGFHNHHHQQVCNTLYPTKLFNGDAMLCPPSQHMVYATTTSPPASSLNNNYPPPSHPVVHDYFVGHQVNPQPFTFQNLNAPPQDSRNNYYTCIGTPVAEGSGGGGGSGSQSPYDQHHQDGF